ncbi:MAG: chemotaxis protein CheW [Phycisphaerales bacterium]
MSSLAVIWRAGGLLFSTTVENIAEVLSPVKATELPSVPDWMRGLFVFRGELIPLVDGARLLGRPSGVDRMVNRVLVVRTRNGASENLVGVWVESVLELARPSFAAQGAHPGLANEQTRFLGRVAQMPMGAVQEVLPAELFTPEQAELLWSRVKAGAR